MRHLAVLIVFVAGCAHQGPATPPPDRDTLAAWSAGLAATDAIVSSIEVAEPATCIARDSIAASAGIASLALDGARTGAPIIPGTTIDPTACGFDPLATSIPDGVASFVFGLARLAVVAFDVVQPSAADCVAVAWGKATAEYLGNVAVAVLDYITGTEPGLSWPSVTVDLLTCAEAP